MKAFSTLLFAFIVLSVTAQSPNKNPAKNNSVNTIQTTKAKPLGAPASIQNMVQTLKHDTCLDKKFSVVFYLFNDSTFSLNNTSTLTAAITQDVVPIINLLNSTFKRICVSFENCSTKVIPDYTYAKWSSSTEYVVTNNWYTENTLNIYIPKLIDYTICFADYAYMPALSPPTAKRNFIVTYGAGPGLLHAVGHFFGLPHTCAEIAPNTTSLSTPSPTNAAIISKEFVDRTNCYLHGDGFCDTEADPNYNNPANPKHSYCNYNGLSVDGKGQYYIPPTDNYMSNYINCMCLFTQEQYNFMARTILKQRLYLH